MAVASNGQNFSLLHITKIQLSAVRYNWLGTSDGCPDRGARPVLCPPFKYHVARYPRLCSATSNRLTSTSRPVPLWRAPRTADTRPSAAVVPVIKSMMDSPNRDGGPSGSPVSDRYPASDCIR